MRKIFIILSLIPTFLFSQAFVDFLPTTTNNRELVHHTYYSLSYSVQHEQAEWVFYEIKKDFNTDKSHGDVVEPKREILHNVNHDSGDFIFIKKK